MEVFAVSAFGGAYSGLRVLVTGHTGFKGSWLSTWLDMLGAEVGGFSVSVPTKPSNFQTIGVEDRVAHFLGDVRNAERLDHVLDSFRPEVVFHLAAQAVVGRAYEEPVETFSVNTIGMVNVLEALRRRPWIRAGVLITSDKCYRNLEWVWGYRETDGLGGDDPYSGSKAAAEIVFQSYYQSFFRHHEELPQIATTRAGNVIGGGDWTRDRVVPDCIRSWSSGEAVVLRSPGATRPWQHVLEPLSGYLTLGVGLLRQGSDLDGESFNFGPRASRREPVSTLVGALAQQWPGARWRTEQATPNVAREANLLQLCCDKALAELNWIPTLTFAEAVRFTAEWYREYYLGARERMLTITLKQIEDYGRAARERGVAWAVE